ncbi:MAG TPA: tyrosine-protein phosphatase [Candidatus Hydrogenedentes bacterium]|nr:tyrosine-protein phosphatase [Candidatus Hydrogenedentota bacterium]
MIIEPIPGVSSMRKAIKIVAILVGAVALVLAVPLWMYFPGHNFRTVEKGAFYGSRQMSGKALEAAIKKRGIQTVINLRGHNPGAPWYDNEVAVCRKLGVAHEDFAWSKGRLPDPESLARFVAVIESGKKPFLAHCEGGTHRTGVAAACYLLLQGADTATARRQFGPMFKNAPIGQVVDLYEGSNMPFKQWVREVYPARYASPKSSQALDSESEMGHLCAAC